MKELIEEFLSFLKTERAAAENTVSSYRGDLRQFSSFCSNQSLTAVTPEILQDYQNWLKRKGFVSSTIARKFASLRSFFNYLTAEGIIKGNPAEKVAIPQNDTRTISRLLTNEEIKRLLEIPAKLSTPKAIRDLAILELILGTGIRANELASLNVEMVNLDPENPYLSVDKKGKVRKIPIPSQTAEDLQQYLKEVRPALAIYHPKAQALFLNQSRWRWGERLTRQGVWIIIRGCARAAGLEGKVTPETLRHSFAARQLALGVSLKKLQELLGHTFPYTTSLLQEKLQVHS